MFTAPCADITAKHRCLYAVPDVRYMVIDSISFCRNTEVLQEQLHAAHIRAEAAEQSAAQAEQLSVQLAELQSRQSTWDKVLQVCAVVHNQGTGAPKLG